MEEKKYRIKEIKISGVDSFFYSIAEFDNHCNMMLNEFCAFGSLVRNLEIELLQLNTGKVWCIYMTATLLKNEVVGLEWYSTREFCPNKFVALDVCGNGFIYAKDIDWEKSVKEHEEEEKEMVPGVAGDFLCDAGDSLVWKNTGESAIYDVVKKLQLRVEYLESIIKK